MLTYARRWQYGICYRYLNAEYLSLFSASSALKCSKGLSWHTWWPCLISLAFSPGREGWKTRFWRKKDLVGEPNDPREGPVRERESSCLCMLQREYLICRLCCHCFLHNVLTVGVFINYSSYVNNALLPDEDETIVFIEGVFSHIEPKEKPWFIPSTEWVTLRDGSLLAFCSHGSNVTFSFKLPVRYLMVYLSKHAVQTAMLATCF